MTEGEDVGGMRGHDDVNAPEVSRRFSVATTWRRVSSGRDPATLRSWLDAVAGCVALIWLVLAGAWANGSSDAVGVGVGLLIVTIGSALCALRTADFMENG